ncbi:MAG: EamA family transporter [Candidatus Pacearchaeota archaeon]
MDTQIYIILLVLFCALLAASGQLFFKLASTKFSLNPLTWIKNPFFIFGVILYAFSAVLFVWSLKNGNLSVLYPIIATSYIWTTILATKVLHEPFTPLKWLGIMLIILGIIIITR